MHEDLVIEILKHGKRLPVSQYQSTLNCIARLEAGIDHASYKILKQALRCIQEYLPREYIVTCPEIPSKYQWIHFSSLWIIFLNSPQVNNAAKIIYFFYMHQLPIIQEIMFGEDKTQDRRTYPSLFTFFEILVFLN